MESARRAAVADRPEVVRLARLARSEAREKRGGALLVDHGLPGEPLDALVPDEPVTDTLVVVGLIDDVVVGYAVVHARDLRTGDRLGVIEELYVHPEARDVSVGETMMDLIVEFGREQGCIGLDAFALPGDRHTKNFFETFGLVARGIVVHRSLLPPAPPTDGPEPAAP
jgi:ribosomal protein S18 acetylase RimI-like enzyme